MNEQAKDALQKAIGRVRSVDPSYFPVYPGGDKQAVADLAVLAQAYLADHPADDDETVTREWLMSLGFVVSYMSDVILHKPSDDDLYIWSENSLWQPAFMNGYRSWIRCVSCKTRGDVRRLCAALGIPLSQ